VKVTGIARHVALKHLHRTQHNYSRNLADRPEFVSGTANPCEPLTKSEEPNMAKAATKTARGRKQDRARGGRKYEVGYDAKKTGRSASAVKKAVKKVGNSRKQVEKRLGR
jgi:hypothetical protein